MPELPEVETVRRGLAEHASGHIVTDVTVLHPRSVRHDGAPQFSKRLRGLTLGTVARRGKYLWVNCGEDALLIHLGMSGQMRINNREDPWLRHTRVILDLDDGSQLRFCDQRMFGGLRMTQAGTPPPLIAHIAPDPFDPAFDERGVARALTRRRSTIKRSLLDQTLVSGIGNIYADEALWAARTHPDQPTTISLPWATRILRHARDVMSRALEAGGTSFDELYVHVNGASGYFERSLNAYGRDGQPCRRCGTLLSRIRFTNRSSYFCPHCQRVRKRAPSESNVSL